jgi:Putative DNA-binding domain
MLESLLDMQTWFAGHITSPILESDADNIPKFPPASIPEIRKRIAPGPSMSSEERLGVYQQQYWWRLINICQEIYPAVLRLFDFEDFNRLIAEPYLLKYPPSDWFLSNIGDALPKWLKIYYKNPDAPLVLGLALLDLAYEKLLFTEILPPLKPESIADCERKKLFLQPFVFLFSLDADLFAFRSELMKEPVSHWQTNDLPPLEKCKKYFVLYRSEGVNLYEEISSEFYSLLTRFKKGARLTALIPFLEKYEGLLESFQVMASRGWLTLTGLEETD